MYDVIGVPSTCHVVCRLCDFLHSRVQKFLRAIDRKWPQGGPGRNDEQLSRRFFFFFFLLCRCSCEREYKTRDVRSLAKGDRLPSVVPNPHCQWFRHQSYFYS